MKSNAKSRSHNKTIIANSKIKYVSKYCSLQFINFYYYLMFLLLCNISISINISIVDALVKPIIPV